MHIPKNNHFVAGVTPGKHYYNLLKQFKRFKRYKNHDGWTFGIDFCI